MISYADFLTLLFALFVLLFAVANGDRAKARQLSEAVRRALENRPAPAARQEQPRPPQPPKAELADAYRYLERQLQPEIAGGKMGVKLEPRGVVVTLRDEAFFPSGGDKLYAAAEESLSKVAPVLTGISNPLLLEGHTDSVPIHNSRFRSNWDLSSARSTAVLEFFESRFGIPGQRFGIAGYADYQPVAENESAEGRALNRRVDIVILNSR